MKLARCLFAIVLLGLVWLVIHACPCSASKIKAVPSFSRNYTEFERLSRSGKAGVEEWRRLMNSFLTIHRSNAKGHFGDRSLFYAGKSALVVYKKAGNRQDLEKAIEFLTTFRRKVHPGPYHTLALSELREAKELLKKTVITSSEKIPVRMNIEDQSHVSSTSGPVVRQIGEQCSTDVSIGRGETSKIGKSYQAESGLQGNPFCRSYAPGHKKIPIPIRTAAIQPNSANDGDVRKSVVRESRSPFVIVLDPGHGGKNPGAVSKDGLVREKDVTLNIAKRLKKLLEKKNPGISVALTRNDDTFMSLTERTSVANSLNSDMFLSIHCNAADDSRSRGIETFYLSKASSMAAMRVAARENGIPFGKMTDLEATLLDLMVSSKKSESSELAETIHKSLIDKLKAQPALSARDRGVKRAPFYVLLGAKMPAVLVECAFISNSSEKSGLTRSENLDSISQAISEGINDYFASVGNKGAHLAETAFNMGKKQ